MSQSQAVRTLHAALRLTRGRIPLTIPGLAEVAAAFTLAAWVRPAALGRAVTIYPRMRLKQPGTALAAGRYDDLSSLLQKDDLLSIAVPPGFRAVLFRDPGCAGPAIVVDRDTPELAPGWSVKSLAVLDLRHRRQQLVVVFSEAGHRGDARVLGLGQYADLGALGLDRTIASLLVPPGIEVALYTGTSMASAPQLVQGDVHDLGEVAKTTRSLAIHGAPLVAGDAALGYPDTLFRGAAEVAGVGPVSERGAWRSLRIPDGLALLRARDPDLRYRLSSGDVGAARLVGAAWTADGPRQVLRFDGKQAHVDIGRLSLGGRGFTVEATVRWRSLRPWTRIIDLGNGADADNIFLSTGTDGRQLAFGVHTPATKMRIVHSGRTVEVNRWTRVVATVDKAGQARIYLDGVQVVAAALAAPREVLRESCFVGRSNWNSDPFADMDVASLRLWDRDLDADEIAAGPGTLPPRLRDDLHVVVGGRSVLANPWPSGPEFVVRTPRGADEGIWLTDGAVPHTLLPFGVHDAAALPAFDGVMIPAGFEVALADDKGDKTVRADARVPPERRGRLRTITVRRLGRVLDDDAGTGLALVSVPPLAATAEPELRFAGARLAPGRWHHLALTWDGKTRRHYLDGREVASDTPSAPAKLGGAWSLGGGLDGAVALVVARKGARDAGLLARERFSLPAQDDPDVIAAWAQDSLTVAEGRRIVVDPARVTTGAALVVHAEMPAAPSSTGLGKRMLADVAAHNHTRLVTAQADAAAMQAAARTRHATEKQTAHGAALARAAAAQIDQLLYVRGGVLGDANNAPMPILRLDPKLGEILTTTLCCDGQRLLVTGEHFVAAYDLASGALFGPIRTTRQLWSGPTVWGPPVRDMSRTYPVPTYLDGQWTYVIPADTGLLIGAVPDSRLVEPGYVELGFRAITCEMAASPPGSWATVGLVMATSARGDAASYDPVTQRVWRCPAKDPTTGCIVYEQGGKVHVIRSGSVVEHITSRDAQAASDVVEVLPWGSDVRDLIRVSEKWVAFTRLEDGRRFVCVARLDNLADARWLYNDAVRGERQLGWPLQLVAFDWHGGNLGVFGKSNAYFLLDNPCEVDGPQGGPEGLFAVLPPLNAGPGVSRILAGSQGIQVLMVDNTSHWLSLALDRRSPGRVTVDWNRGLLIVAAGGAVSFYSVVRPDGAIVSDVACETLPSANKSSTWVTLTSTSFPGGEIRSRRMLDTRTVVKDRPPIHAIAADPTGPDDASRVIYWIEGTGALWRARLDGTNATQLVPQLPPGREGVWDLVLDERRQVLFWTNGRAVWRAQVQGDALTGVAIVVPTADSPHPIAVAVEDTSGDLLWVDAEREAVLRADPDGNLSRQLYPALRPRPALAVDALAKRIYWNAGAPERDAAIVDRPGLFHWLQDTGDGVMRQQIAELDDTTLVGAVHKLSARDSVVGGRAVLGFDGQQAHVDIGWLDLDLRHGFTVEAWVLWHELRGWSRIFDLGNGTDADNVFVMLDGDPRQVVLGVHQPQGRQILHTGSVAVVDRWTHVAATLDAAGQAAFYIDGKAVASGPLALPRSVVRTRCYVGRSNWPTDPYPRMDLAMLRLWSRGLSPTEIAANAASLGDRRLPQQPTYHRARVEPLVGQPQLWSGSLDGGEPAFAHLPVAVDRGFAMQSRSVAAHEGMIAALREKAAAQAAADAERVRAHAAAAAKVAAADAEKARRLAEQARQVADKRTDAERRRNDANADLHATRVGQAQRVDQAKVVAVSRKATANTQADSRKAQARRDHDQRIDDAHAKLAATQRRHDAAKPK